MFKFIQREKNRKLARKEHENIDVVYYLPFNKELQARLQYKKALLVNEIFETSQLDKNSYVDIINVENMININMQKGLIDMFYNKVMK